MAGSFESKSSKILMNSGTILYMMKTRMPHGHHDDDDRVDQRAFDLALERLRTFPGTRPGGGE